MNAEFTGARPREKIGDQAADEAVGGKQDILRMIEEAIANKPVGHLSKYV